MPEMTPVGNTITPPNPMQGINTLSGIFGIQQQRQQLQLQAQELQRSQLETQQAQGVNQFFSQWDPGQHRGVDGTLDIDSAHNSPAYQALPGVARIAVDAKMNALRSQQLQAKQQLATLNGDVVSQFGKVAQAASQTDPSTAKQLFDEFGKQGPDNQRIMSIYGPALGQLPPDKLKNALINIAAQAQDISAQQAQTNPAIITNAANQNLGYRKGTGEVFEIPTSRLGSPTNPSSPTVAGLAAGATTRAAGTGNADIDTVNQVQQAQGQASQTIALTQQARLLKDAIDSGNIAALASKGAAFVGITNVNEARAQLEQDLGKLRGVAIAHQGSDARAGQILEGYPTATTPSNTFHADMDWFSGVARQTKAAGDLVNKLKAKDPSATGAQTAVSVLNSATNPLMHEYMALSPQDKVAFIKRNFPNRAAAEQFINQLNAAKTHTNVIGQ